MLPYRQYNVYTLNYGWGNACMGNQGITALRTVVILEVMSFKCLERMLKSENAVKKAHLIVVSTA